MRPNELTPAELHAAGATVRHRSPFEALPVPAVAVDVAAMPEWSRRLFQIGLFEPSETLSVVGEHLPEVDEDLVRALLSTFDWRPKTIGAHLAALRNVECVEQLIGHLLLRSDVCYAGSAYCITLAHFNTERSRKFLTDYLDYYLTRRDLWFEQRDALAAIVCLDERNGTSIAARYASEWKAYSKDKPNVRLEPGVEHLRRQLRVVSNR